MRVGGQNYGGVALLITDFMETTHSILVTRILFGKQTLVINIKSEPFIERMYYVYW